MPASPRALSGLKIVLPASLVVGCALLALKWALLGPFVVARASASVILLAIFVVAMLYVAQWARADRMEAAFASLPVFLVLIVALANTPMAYEEEAFARRAPHAEGASAPVSEVVRPFLAGHPSTRVEWTFAPRNASLLAEQTADAFEADGWRVVSSVPPGADGFGYVLAEKWAFRASCNVWESPTTRVHCLITV